MRKKISWLIVLVVVALAGLGFYKYRMNERCVCAPLPLNWKRFPDSCRYDTVIIPAELVFIDTAKMKEYHLPVQVAIQHPGNKADTITMELATPGDIMLTSNLYQSANIREGDTIVCRQLNSHNGACAPVGYECIWKLYRPMTSRFVTGTN